MKYLNAILLVIALGATIGLFYLLATETNTPLFYFNLSFACVLEVLLLGAVLTISKKRLFNIPNLAIVSQISFYVFIAAAVMIVYNLLPSGILDAKWYFGALILLTAIYAILIIFVTKGASYQLAAEETQKNQIQQRQLTRINCSKLIPAFNDALAGKNPDYAKKEACRKSIELLVEKTTMIPLAKAERNQAYMEDLNRKIDQLYDEFQATTQDEEPEKTIDRLKKAADRIVTHIDQTKSMLS
jgi:hypothetical protein